MQNVLNLQNGISNLDIGELTVRQTPDRVLQKCVIDDVIK